MTVNTNTLSGSGSGIAIAEETSQKVAGSDWFVFPRTDGFTPFKRNRNVVEDDSISSSYQQARGRNSGHDAEGGFTAPMQPELMRFAPGFIFADVSQGFSTAPYGAAQATVDDVDGAGAYDTSLASVAGVAAGDLIFAEGFGDADNNGLGKVTANASGIVTVDTVGTTADASPATTGKISKVGIEAGSGDLGLVLSGTELSMTSTLLDFTGIGAVVGGWIFIGGDAAGEQFGAGYGYARVSEISANLLKFDEVAWVGTLATDAGAAKTIRLFVGDFIRYEDETANQTSTSYNVRRLIGEDTNGMMSEYLEGAYINTLKLSGSLDAKHTAELSFVALDKTTRTGAEGLKAGTEIDLYDAERKPMVTPADVFRLKLSIVAAEHNYGTELFAYASEFSLEITNNLSVIRAVNALDGIDVNRGVAAISGSITPYIKDSLMIAALDNDDDLAFNAILALENRGVVYDIPYLMGSDDGLQIAQNDPVTLNVSMSGAKNRYGYSFAMTSFRYLPDAAMPVQ